jgi:deoxyribonuclease-2
MGNCFTVQVKKKDVLTQKKFLIKIPSGTRYIEYKEQQKKFVKCDDINTCIKSMYSNSKWTSWIVYNDETSKVGLKHTTKGHCKGIVAWNKTTISWLCHSVPNYPYYFEGNKISAIESSELMYGQSFQYMEVDYSKELLDNILNQLEFMNANIYIQKDVNIVQTVHNHNNINKIELCSDVHHLAKSPKHEIDIYSEYIATEYKFKWKTETWKRGHEITTKCENVTDISSIYFEDIEYSESRDHSKWAVSDNEYYWIGDLNRMKSQYKRGGGGFICKDDGLTRALERIIFK